MIDSAPSSLTSITPTFLSELSLSYFFSQGATSYLLKSNQSYRVSPHSGHLLSFLGYILLHSRQIFTKPFFSSSIVFHLSAMYSWEKTQLCRSQVPFTFFYTTHSFYLWLGSPPYNPQLQRAFSNSLLSNELMWCSKT